MKQWWNIAHFKCLLFFLSSPNLEHVIKWNKAEWKLSSPETQKRVVHGVGPTSDSFLRELFD